MIDRFVKVVGAAVLICLATAGSRAQQAPEAPKPAATQEGSQEESTSRKAKPHDYKNWTFNVGGGANLPHGTTNTFVKGGGLVADAGVARNYSKYFGFRLAFSWTYLPLRGAALQRAQATSGTNQVYGLTLDPIFYIPATKLYRGY